LTDTPKINATNNIVMVHIPIGDWKWLKCPVIAKPQASIEWYSDGQLEQSNGENIKVKILKEDDYKNYTCVATNSVGKDTATFVIEQVGKKLFLFYHGFCFYVFIHLNADYLSNPFILFIFIHSLLTLCIHSFVRSYSVIHIHSFILLFMHLRYSFISFSFIHSFIDPNYCFFYFIFSSSTSIYSVSN